MDKLEDYKIPFTGLPEGIHQFDFRCTGAFFEEFGNTELGEADFKIMLDMIKESNFMELQLTFEGYFSCECDRCGEDMQVSLEGDRKLIAKVTEPSDDEDILVLRSHDTALDLARSFYETIVVAMPLRRAHTDEGCNPEVLERLDSYSQSESEESDPRWDALKKLKSSDSDTSES